MATASWHFSQIFVTRSQILVKMLFWYIARVQDWKLSFLSTTQNCHFVLLQTCPNWKFHFFLKFPLNFGPPQTLCFHKNLPSAWSKILLKIFHYGLLQICPDRNFHSFQTFFPDRCKILLKIFHYGLLQICPDRNFHLFQTFFPHRSKILLKIVITVSRFCAKLLLWSTADMSRQKISLFPKNFAWATILHKNVILEHCGHIQIENFTFSKKLCLIKDSAQTYPRF